MVFGAFGEIAAYTNFVRHVRSLRLDRSNKRGAVERTTKDAFDNVLGKRAGHTARRDLCVEVVQDSICVFKEGRVMRKNNGLRNCGHAP